MDLVGEEMGPLLNHFGLASTPTPRPSPMSPVVRPHVAPEPGLDYRSMARESGEGEEQPDEESVMSFERILQTPRIHSGLHFNIL